MEGTRGAAREDELSTGGIALGEAASPRAAAKTALEEATAQSISE